MIQQTYIRIDGKKLEHVAEKIFQENYFEVAYNDYSSICAMVCITGKDILMDKIRSLEYYGFKTTLIQSQEAGYVIHVYQNQDNEGHKI